MRTSGILILLVVVTMLIFAFPGSGQTQTGRGPLGVYDGSASFLGYLIDAGGGGPTYVVFNPDIPAFFKVSAVWPNPLLKACEGWAYYYKSGDCSGQPYILGGDSSCNLRSLAFDSFAGTFYIYDPQVPIASICDLKSARLATSCTAFGNPSCSSATIAFPIKQIDVPILGQGLQYPIAVMEMTPLSSTYTLSVNLSPSTGGWVTVTPQKSAYNANEVVTLMANPNTGYIFNNWSGDASGTAASIQVTMTKNMTLTANFTSGPGYTLSVNLNSPSAGSVTVTPQKSLYNLNEVVTLMANPDTGYTFVNWSGDATGTNASIQVTMTKNMTLTANFGPISSTPTLTVTINPPNYGYVILSPAGGSYPPGTMVTLTARSNLAYRHFVNWSGDTTGTIAGTTNPITITMPNSNLTVTANFK